MIVGDYKIVCGSQDGMGFHQFPGFPNGSAFPTPDVNCSAPNCCLFNIQTDPTETTDLRETEPAAYANMTAVSAGLVQRGVPSIVCECCVVGGIVPKLSLIHI